MQAMPSETECMAPHRWTSEDDDDMHSVNMLRCCNAQAQAHSNAGWGKGVFTIANQRYQFKNQLVDLCTTMNGRIKWQNVKRNKMHSWIVWNTFCTCLNHTYFGRIAMAQQHICVYVCVCCVYVTDIIFVPSGAHSPQFARSRSLASLHRFTVFRSCLCRMLVWHFLIWLSQIVSGRVFSFFLVARCIVHTCQPIITSYSPLIDLLASIVIILIRYKLVSKIICMRMQWRHAPSTLPFVSSLLDYACVFVLCLRLRFSAFLFLLPFCYYLYTVKRTSFSWHLNFLQILLRLLIHTRHYSW